MPVFNTVRFRVKPGQETRFLDAHRDGKANWPGLLRGAIIATGDRSYCLIGEWADADARAQARAGAGGYVQALDPQALNGSNRMRLFVFPSADGTQARLVALLDNLGKGASGAAVQNLNLMLGLPEAAGL